MTSGTAILARLVAMFKTPIINDLAKQGMLFSNFHVLPTCSPTRSALLSGNDNHVAGLGIMGEMDYPALHHLQLPGYSAELSEQVVTIPEVLRTNGYHAYMTGKWHLGEAPVTILSTVDLNKHLSSVQVEESHLMTAKALSLLQHMEYTRNGKIVDPPQDFYSSRNYTDSMLQRLSTGIKPMANLSWHSSRSPRFTIPSMRQKSI